MSADRISFRLENQEIQAPEEWKDMRILSTFDNNTNQATVTTDLWTFVNTPKEDTAKKVSDLFRSGLNGGTGSFEGPCFDIYVSDDEGAVQVFEGMLDFAGEYVESQFKDQTNFEDPLKVRCRAIMMDSLNGIDDLIQGATVSYLESKGVYTNSDYVDVDWVIEKKFDFVEFMILSLGVYSLVKEAIEVVRDFGVDTSVQAGISSSSITGSVGGVLYRILVIIFRIAYLVLILIQIINLSTQLINLVISKKRTHKGIRLRTLLEKGLDFFGYKLVSPIQELDTYVYLPTLPFKESNFAEKIFNKVKVIEKGIPNVGDTGYLLSEVVQFCSEMFNARYAVVNGNEVHLRWEDDPWWFKQSDLNITEDHRFDEITYNTDELSRDIFLKFQTDPSDKWTSDNYTGTSFESITEAQTVKDPKKQQIRGLDQVDFPFALGNRKDGLNALEEFALGFANAAEQAVNAVGGNADYTSSIKNRTNLLKVSDPIHSIPKILYMPGNNIPANHRDFLSARVLYEKYHSSKSFIANNFRAQKIRFDNVEVDFRFRDFKNLMKNPYFVTTNGRSGKIEKASWRLAGDTATISGWFRQVYTKNLTERTIEP